MSTANAAPSALLISVVYDAPYKRVAIDFRIDGDHEIATLGDVTDEEIAALIAAEGADVAGWSSYFKA